MLPFIVKGLRSEGRGLRRRAAVRLTTAIAIVVLAGFGALQAGGLLAAAPRPRTQELAPATGDPPPGAQVVRVGIHVNRIYEVSVSDNSFYLDAYIWLRWHGELDPVAKLELLNGMDRWGTTVEADYETPRVDPDGTRYQVLHVEGRFQHAFDLSRYPLDRQEVDLLLENSVHGADELVFLPDDGGSGVSGGVVLPGWRIQGWSWQRFLHTYPTAFGDPGSQGGESRYSALRFRVQLQRPFSYFLWKLLLPLIVVLVSGLGALLLHPRFPDARIAMPATALLTAVFLQQSYTSTLPEIGYMVLMDRVYALSYLLIIAAVIAMIATANLAKEDDEASYARVRKIDRAFLGMQMLAFVAGVTWLALRG